MEFFGGAEDGPFVMVNLLKFKPKAQYAAGADAHACGTAFGDEHARVLRRFLHDHEEFRGEVIFTFDGDAAGRRAAMRAAERALPMTVRGRKRQKLSPRRACRVLCSFSSTTTRTTRPKNCPPAPWRCSTDPDCFS